MFKKVLVVKVLKFCGRFVKMVILILVEIILLKRNVVVLKVVLEKGNSVEVMEGLVFEEDIMEE